MIGLIVAMTSEFELVVKALNNVQIKKIKHLRFAIGDINGKSVVLLKSGMGKVNAAIGAVTMIDNFAPSCIINTGLAGGVDKNLSVMDVVAGADVVYHDVWCGPENAYGQVQELPEMYHADTELLKKLSTINTDVQIKSGLITSGDKFITQVSDLEQIKSVFPAALAVDMESAAIAQTCYLADIPFLSLRIISDTPGIENHYAQYRDFWNQAPEKSLDIIKQLLKD